MNLEKTCLDFSDARVKFNADVSSYLFNLTSKYDELKNHHWNTNEYLTQFKISLREGQRYFLAVYYTINNKFRVITDWDLSHIDYTYSEKEFIKILKETFGFRNFK